MTAPIDELDVARASRDALHNRIAGGGTVKPGDLSKADEAVQVAELGWALRQRTAAKEAERVRLARIAEIGDELRGTVAPLGDAVEAARLRLVADLVGLTGAIDAYDAQKAILEDELRNLCLGGIPGSVDYEMPGQLLRFRSHSGHRYIPYSVKDQVERALRAGLPNSGLTLDPRFG